MFIYAVFDFIFPVSRLLYSLLDWSHPHYAYVQGRLQKLTQACAELAEGSVQRPRNEQV